MSGAIDKTLSILEYLASRPQGAELVDIANSLNQSRSGCHRTLLELIGYGYVRQTHKGEYRLTTKLPSMGLNYLSRSGLVDIAQPALRRLAEQTGELVRLGIRDGERISLMAKAQGQNSGLLYDPDMGIDLRLSCSAAGHAWLMTLTDEEAIAAVGRQGFGDPKDFGPDAPTTFETLIPMLQEHRRRGYSITRDIYAPGLTSIAAPVRRRGEPTTAMIVVAGPTARMTDEKLTQFSAHLVATADELALLGNASPLLDSRSGGTWGNKG